VDRGAADLPLGDDLRAEEDDAIKEQEAKAPLEGGHVSAALSIGEVGGGSRHVEGIPASGWNLRPARQAGFEVNGQVADKNLDGVVAVAEVLNQFVMASPRVACPSMRKHSARRSMTLWRSTGQKERKNQLWRARGRTIASVSGNDISFDHSVARLPAMVRLALLCVGSTRVTLSLSCFLTTGQRGRGVS
jgi:hypothetical protein